jgi:hypothetical protein
MPVRIDEICTVYVKKRGMRVLFEQEFCEVSESIYEIKSSEHLIVQCTIPFPRHYQRRDGSVLYGYTVS